MALEAYAAAFSCLGLIWRVQDIPFEIFTTPGSCVAASIQPNELLLDCVGMQSFRRKLLDRTSGQIQPQGTEVHLLSRDVMGLSMLALMAEHLHHLAFCLRVAQVDVSVIRLWYLTVSWTRFESSLLAICQSGWLHPGLKIHPKQHVISYLANAHCWCVSPHAQACCMHL